MPEINVTGMIVCLNNAILGMSKKHLNCGQSWEVDIKQSINFMEDLFEAVQHGYSELVYCEKLVIVKKLFPPTKLVLISM